MRPGARNLLPTLVAALALLAPLAAAPPAGAGAALETFDLTGWVPGPIPGTVVAQVVPVRWDDRCVPTPMRINSTLDPVPNPLGADFLSVATAGSVFSAAMDRWNAVPTSYAELLLAGTVPNPGLQGFDTVNEITFRTSLDFDFIAATSSTALMEDALLVDGEDLDGDGDPDVAAGISTCADVDADGDLEHPAGFYPAGTLFDSDVLLNTRVDGYRFTVGDAALDTDVRSVDLEAIAVHELGHVLGLAHVLNNQVGAGDGTAATLYPFTDTGDPDAERAQRSLDADDRAFVSLFYPEGTAATGPAALTSDDVAFADVYALLEGEVVDGDDGLPVAGASVGARTAPAGDLLATALSGTVRLLLDGDGVPVLSAPRPFYLLDGRYRLPVPQGPYRLDVEAVDGAPVASSSMNITTRVGDLLGQQDFQQEGWNGVAESAYERRPGDARTVPAHAGRVSGGHRFVTDVASLDAPFGDRDNFGFVASPPGFFLAVRFPATDVAARLQAGQYLVAGLMRTLVLDASTLPLFAAAALVPGHVQGDGTAVLDLLHPLEIAAPFLGEDDDFAPLYVHEPEAVAARILGGVERGELEDLFLVLRVPLATPFPGANGIPPGIGLDRGEDPGLPVLGRSFASLDGAVFFPDPRFNFMFALQYGGG